MEQVQQVSDPRLTSRQHLWMETLFLLFTYLAGYSLLAGGPGRFFSEPAGPAFLVMAALTVISERASRHADPRGAVKDRGTANTLTWALLLVPAVGLLDYYWLRPRLHLLEWSWGWLAAGAMLALLGTVVRVISIRKLGKFFSKTVRIHEEHKIVQDGIYRRIRHPAYTGLLLVWGGYVTLFASLWGYLALVLLMLPALASRIRVEEKALLECFEADYRAYCDRTWRLVPFLY
jgi:protein-S-isoprenylcysteine O-methyltransferase Ste14